MDTDASQRETREPFWLRLAHHGFAALVMGSAVLLAAGGAPFWVERTAVVFLWTLVVLFYLGMAIAFMSYRMPAPETLRQHEADGGQHRRGGSRIKRAVRRLLHLLLVAALAISGRPVLAGLYLLAPFTGVAVDVGRKRWIEGVERPDVSAGRWAVYQVFRHAFRAVPWVLLSGGVPFETFFRQTQVACEAGASGVMVGRAVWMINSTPRGGGVAEMLP